MDPNGCPTKFVVMQCHVRLRAASRILLYAVLKIRGQAEAGRAAKWDQILCEGVVDPCKCLYETTLDSDNFCNNKF